MSQSASNPGKTIPAPAGKALPPPFLLTISQGKAARMLLSYVVSLPLPGPDPQLLAVVAAIRAARGGVGNLTGTDLSTLGLGDPREAVDALRSLGWRIEDAIFDRAADAPPVPVTVPDLARETNHPHPLPFGKSMRSRVSGWTTRTLSAKPIRKLPPAARLAGLFLAAHSTPDLLGQIPSDLPEACRAALPSLLDKGFLTELSGDRYRLAPQVRHLSGMRPPTDEERAAEPTTTRAKAAGSPRFEFSAETWTRWKNAATPALGRHVESVENCALCALPQERVAEAFLLPFPPTFFSQNTKAAYARWKETHPARGPQAARFTVLFRAGHGHGPSYRQLCEGLGWKQNHQGRGFVVQRLVVNGWLNSTGAVPWTLRPGSAAQERGITLPRARNSATRTDAVRP